jgi:hypothetical protein
MISVVESMEMRHNDTEGESDWAKAQADWSAGDPADLTRPARKITIVYRYTDGRFYATSPDLTGFDLSGGNLHETRQLVREDLARFLDPAVELREVLPRDVETEGTSDSQVMQAGEFLIYPRSSGTAVHFASQRRLRVS